MSQSSREPLEIIELIAMQVPFTELVHETTAVSPHPALVRTTSKVPVATATATDTHTEHRTF